MAVSFKFVTKNGQWGLGLFLLAGMVLKKYEEWDGVPGHQGPTMGALFYFTIAVVCDGSTTLSG